MKLKYKIKTLRDVNVLIKDIRGGLTLRFYVDHTICVDYEKNTLTFNSMLYGTTEKHAIVDIKRYLWNNRKYINMSLTVIY